MAEVRHQRRSPARTLSYLVLATLLGLVLAELGARVLELVRDPGPVEARSAVGFQQLPAEPLLRPVEGFPGWLQPAPGLIDDSSLVVPPKAEGELRIVTLGGSAVGGWSVARNHTFSAIMGRALDDVTDRPVRVLNLGRIGYASSQMAWLFERMAPQLQPDVVVAVMGNNERHDLAVEVTREGQAGPVLRRRELFRRSALARLMRPSRPIHGDPDGRAGVGDDTPPTRPVDLTEIDAYAHARWRRSLTRIASAAAALGATTVVGTVGANHRYRPSKHEWSFLGAEQLQLEETRASYARVRFGLDDHVPAPVRSGPNPDDDYPCVDGDRLWYAGRVPEAREAYDACWPEASLYRADDALNAVIRSEAAAQGLPLVDIEAALHARSPHDLPDYDVFYDYCHYTPRGNVFVGHVLARGVADALGLSPPLAPEDAEATWTKTWADRVRFGSVRPVDPVRFPWWIGTSGDPWAIASLRYGEGTIEHDLGPPGTGRHLAYMGNRLRDRGSVAELRWWEAAASAWCRALGVEWGSVAADPNAGRTDEEVLGGVTANLEDLLAGPAGNHLRSIAGADAIEGCLRGVDPWHRDALPSVDDI